MVMSPFPLDYSSYPGIRAKCISGKNIELREVEVEDAEFIISLRTDTNLNRYLSPVLPDVQLQRNWILDCKSKFDQAYFIVQTKKEEPQPIGTVRLYDPTGKGFTWGSWILSNEAPTFAAIESALIVYDYGFNVLGFDTAHFEVLQGNPSITFHPRLGARVISEDERAKYFSLAKEDYLRAKPRYAKYALERIIVIRA